MDNFTPAETGLQRILQKYRESSSSTFKNWPSLVGTFLCEHTRLQDLNKGILTIDCDHPAFAHLLFLRKKDIIASVRNIQEGELIEDLRFRIVSEKKKEVTIRKKSAVSLKKETAVFEENSKKPRDFSSVMEAFHQACVTVLQDELKNA